MQRFFTFSQQKSIAIIKINNPPINALGQAIRQELADVIQHCQHDDSIEGVILAGEGKTFIAGADITEFDKPLAPPDLPELVASIEASQKPWVAAIHGFALGGGLEVALGCRFRLAVASAKLGLPEVTLGILPGAGGTVRLPRVIGLPAAITMITSGEWIEASEALKLGLLDGLLTHEQNWLEEARQWLEIRLSLLGSQPLGLPLSQQPSPSLTMAEWEDWQTKVTKAAKGAKAPLEALDCLNYGSKHSFSEALDYERKMFMKLRPSPQSQALRHVFFAERRAKSPPALKSYKPPSFETAVVIGAGTMGSGIATALLLAGYNVGLSDQSEERVESGLTIIRQNLQSYAKRGKITDAACQQALSKLFYQPQNSSLAKADVVIEAVFENLEVKQELFANLALYCREDCLLATNTSYLNPEIIAQGLAHGERFLGLHFFSPAHVMKLLEIIPTSQTSPQTLAAAYQLANRLGKIAVEAGITEGFIGNRIWRAVRMAAEQMVIEGVAYHSIDEAMREFGYGMGPFEVQDLSGLDIAYQQREAARAKGEAIPETLGDVLVKAGRMGQKTGGGWYNYTSDNRIPQISEQTKALIRPYLLSTPQPTIERGLIAQRLVGVMVKEGELILEEGFAQSASDIDLVMIHGYGFPRWRGGPLFMRQQNLA